MRTSMDEYKTKEGTIVAVSQDEEPPINSKLWKGYDYTNQEWVFEGKKDIRTLEELRNAMNI